MKKLLTLTLAFMALTAFSGFAMAQETGEVKIGPPKQLPSKAPSLPCCECLGQTTTLNLNTGQRPHRSYLESERKLSLYHPSLPRVDFAVKSTSDPGKVDPTGGFTDSEQ